MHFKHILLLPFFFLYRMMMESQIPIISPIKPPHRELHHAGTITDFPDTEYEDDVFT